MLLRNFLTTLASEASLLELLVGNVLQYSNNITIGCTFSSSELMKIWICLCFCIGCQVVVI
jgi:hypothetical protein